MADNNRSLIDLPKVNLEGILSNLPLPSLHVCCSVSKSLLNLIKNDSNFARIHLAKSEPQLMIQCEICSSIHMVDLDTTDATSRVEVKPSFNIPLDGFGVLHSCNGLLLLDSLNMANGIHRLMLCNLVTGEFTLLPQSLTLYKSGTSAFFYCPKTHHFEVLSTFHILVPDLDGSSDSDSESIAMGEIYVKGTDSWEPLGNLPFSPLTIYNPCHLHKAIHWIRADETVSNVLVFFNFETHEFGEIPVPAHLGKTRVHACYGLTLLVLGDRLTVFDHFTSETRLDVWVMKEYGVKDSWSRDYVIDNTVWGVSDFLPIICRNNGELVMLSVHGYILFYDLLKKKGRVVIHPAIETAWCVMTHTPSLVSLRDVVSGCNLEVVNVRSRFADPELNPLNYLQLAATF